MYESAVYFLGKGGVRVELHVLVTILRYKVLIEYHRKILSYYF